MSTPRWYFTASGTDDSTIVGPLDVAAIRQLKAAGVIHSSHLLRREGEEHWFSVDAVDLDAPTNITTMYEPAVTLVAPGYHLSLAGESSGPFPLAELRERWERGEIAPATLVWKEGSSDWIGIGQILNGLPANAVPPIKLSSMSTAGTTLPNPLPLTICLGVCGLTSLIVFVNQAVRVVDPDDFGGLLAFLFLASIVGSIATWAVLHHRLWKLLPVTFRTISPRRAVGLMFIPFFNFYWGFVTWPKLWRGLLDWQEGVGLRRESDPRETALLLAILPCALALMIALNSPSKLRIFVIYGFFYLLCAFYWRVARIVGEIQRRHLEEA